MGCNAPDNASSESKVGFGRRIPNAVKGQERRGQKQCRRTERVVSDNTNQTKHISNIILYLYIQRRWMWAPTMPFDFSDESPLPLHMIILLGSYIYPLPSHRVLLIVSLFSSQSLSLNGIIWQGAKILQLLSILNWLFLASYKPHNSRIHCIVMSSTSSRQHRHLECSQQLANTWYRHVR